MPHMWLADGRSVFDLLGFDWSLVVVEGGDGKGVARFRAAADAVGVGLTVVDLAAEDARSLYGADLLLVRPDQIVAWRGAADSRDARSLLWELMGHAAVEPKSRSLDVGAVE